MHDRTLSVTQFFCSCLVLAALFLAHRAAVAATFVVTTTADRGPGSLRQAILNANATREHDVIVFDIQGTGPHTIAPETLLPYLTNPVTIDGYTQPGARPNTLPDGNDARLMIRIDGGGVGGDAFRLLASDSTIRGLVITNYLGGIYLGPGRSRNVIAGNFITGIGRTAVDLDNAANNRIGGVTPADRNVLSGNGAAGVHIRGPGAGGNLVQGNFIGTTFDGEGDLGNGGRGVIIGQGTGNLIGGPARGARNVVSGNGSNGVEIGNDGSGNRVEGNFIGTDAAGANRIPNDNHGIEFVSAGNSVGGETDTPGTPPGNLISGNIHFGLRLRTAAVVRGNLIGTDRTGTAALGNGDGGLFIQSGPQGSTIGGATARARNIISGNGGDGIVVLGSQASGNRIQSNLIGTDLSGNGDLGNGGNGLLLNGPDNVVGGAASAPGAPPGNVISGNGGSGLWVRASGNVIQGNVIGATASRGGSLGNEGHGILVEGNISGTAVGGASGTANLIAFNGRDGVSLPRTTGGTLGHAILTNSIHSNTGLGIDLGNDGVTPNDPRDTDTGPNELQNYPVLSSATRANGATTVRGTLNSTPATRFRIEFFLNDQADPSGHGEGQVFAGSTDVTTDAAGEAAFAVRLSRAAAVGQFVTATSTDPERNTSEFSGAVVVRGAVSLSIGDVRVTEGDTGTVDAVFPVTLSGPSDAPVTVDFATAPGTGAADEDYVPRTGSVTFAPGVTSQTILVRVTGDTQVEADETFFVNLSNPANATIADRQGTGTILTDDRVLRADVAVTKTDAPHPVRVGQILTYTITMRNLGPDTANLVRLPDRLAPEVTFIDAMPPPSAREGNTLFFDLAPLAPEQSHTIRIRVRPNTAGLLQNTVTVLPREQDPDTSNNAATTTTSVLPADGGGDRGRIEATPRPVRFPLTQVGRSRRQQVVIRNRGNAPVQVIVEGVGRPFSVARRRFTLAPGERRNIRIRFRPRREAIYRSYILLRTDNADQPRLRVPVEGDACRGHPFR